MKIGARANVLFNAFTRRFIRVKEANEGAVAGFAAGLQPAPKPGHTTEIGPAAPIQRAAACGNKHHGAEPLRVAQRHFLGDHAAHGNAYQTCRFSNTRSIQNSHRIFSHQADAVGSARNVTAPHTSIVQQDDAMLRGQERHDAIPHLERKTEAHHEQNRIARAMLFPINPGSAMRNVRHELQDEDGPPFMPDNYFCRPACEATPFHARFRNLMPSQAISSGLSARSRQMDAAADNSPIVNPKLSMVSQPSYRTSRRARNTPAQST